MGAREGPAAPAALRRGVRGGARLHAHGVLHPAGDRAPHMGGHPGHGAFGRQGAGAVMRHGRVLRRHAGGACGLPPRRRGARRPDRAHRPRPPSVRGDHPRRLRARRPRRRIVRRRGGKRALRQLPGRRSPPSGRGAARARLVLREGARLGEAGRHRGFRHVQRHARQEESRRPQKDRRARRARGSGPPAQHGLLAACRSHGGRGHPPDARARRGLRARMGAHRARRGGHRRELLLRIPPRHGARRARRDDERLRAGGLRMQAEARHRLGRSAARSPRQDDRPHPRMGCARKRARRRHPRRPGRARLVLRRIWRRPLLPHGSPHAPAESLEGGR